MTHVLFHDSATAMSVYRKDPKIPIPEKSDDPVEEAEEEEGSEPKCWRCGLYGHKKKDSKCHWPARSEKNCLNYVTMANEDPMYYYMQSKKIREKEERIDELKALLDNSSSDSDSSDSSKMKKKKRKKKKKKTKAKHREDNEKSHVSREAESKRRHRKHKRKHKQPECSPKSSSNHSRKRARETTDFDATRDTHSHKSKPERHKRSRHN